MTQTYRSLIHFNFFFPKVRHLLERVDGDEHRADVRLEGFCIKEHNVWQKHNKMASFWEPKSSLLSFGVQIRDVPWGD